MSSRRPSNGAATPFASRLAFRPRLLPLESREVPSSTTGDTSNPPDPPVTTTAAQTTVVKPSVLVVGSDAGNKPGVTTYNTTTGLKITGFMAYEPTFKGGVRVAQADVTGDGVPDVITAPGPGRAPLIKVYDGTDGTLVNQFMAYRDRFTGGVFVAAADVNGDGHADIITGAGENGGPHVKVFNGAWVSPPTASVPRAAKAPLGKAENTSTGTPTTPATTTPATTTPATTTAPTLDTTTQVLREFMAYDVKFTGGVRVAAGDLNGDGKADIVTGAGTGGSAHVIAWSGADGSVLQNFMAFDRRFTGGIYVSTGDLNADGKADIVVSTGPKGGAQVRSFNGMTGQMMREFAALNVPGSQSAKVAVMDYDQDGSSDILVAVGRQVQIRNGSSGKLKSTINVGDSNFSSLINI